ncbi:MAG TPA: sigma-70 family RNA polymerase sigma factor [Longimicrobiales bacterium]
MTAGFPLRTEITNVLAIAGATGESAVERLVPLIYDDLRAIAHRQLAREHRNHTLQTTALVHEAYLKLVDDNRVTARGRAYFFAAAGRAMRQVLVDHARRRATRKRGGGAEAMSLDESRIAVDDFAAELLDLDRALDRLAGLNPRHARVVECRFFGGLSVEETAEALDVSARTVKSDWALARAWLYDALAGREDSS